MKRTHAVILAAGVGRRLGAVFDGEPKCLLHFDHVSLLARQLTHLAEAGVSRLTIVTGHKAARIEQALVHIAPSVAPDMAVAVLFNPDYRKGSALSCQTAAPALLSGDSVLLMDADVLCDARMLGRLLTSPHANCLLVDRALPPGDEPVKFAAREGIPVGFGKRLSAGVAHDTIAESVGFFRLTPEMAGELVHCCNGYQRAGDSEAPYEHPLRDLMLAQSQAFGYEDITGLPWIEIDFPEDVQRARSHVLPRLYDMPVAS